MTKIYITEMTPKISTSIAAGNIDNYLIKSVNEYYMYSDNNIYKVLMNQIVKLNQIDHPSIIGKLDDYNIIIDKSRYVSEKNSSSHIPLQHVVRKITTREYKLNPLAEVKFVTETNNSGSNKGLLDYYFVLNEGIEEVDHFIKDNIHSFLSLLRNV
jgi:hypothetical protein